MMGDEADADWDAGMIESARGDLRITSVYSFTNGMCMVFDQHGQQMPEFQGYTSEMTPKIRAAGYAGAITRGAWR